MKHIYEKPQVSVSFFSSEDIITLSTVKDKAVDDIGIGDVKESSKFSWTLNN